MTLKQVEGGKGGTFMPYLVIRSCRMAVMKNSTASIIHISQPAHPFSDKGSYYLKHSKHTTSIPKYNTLLPNSHPLGKLVTFVKNIKLANQLNHLFPLN